jgi:hypothetical protein
MTSQLHPKGDRIRYSVDYQDPEWIGYAEDWIVEADDLHSVRVAEEVAQKLKKDHPRLNVRIVEEITACRIIIVE